MPFYRYDGVPNPDTIDAAKLSRELAKFRNVLAERALARRCEIHMQFLTHSGRCGYIFYLRVRVKGVAKPNQRYRLIKNGELFL